MSQAYQEIVNLLMHAGARQVGPRTLTVYGHIVAYDPVNHAIKAQIPGLRLDETSPGIITPWLPLGTPFGGNNYGAQFAPEADASGIDGQTPTGTPCEITLNEQYGAAVVSAIRYTDKHLAPFPTMKAGEAGIKSIAQSFWYLDANGNWKLKVVGQNATIDHEQAQTGSHITQNADGSIDITTGEGDPPPVRVNGELVYLGGKPGATTPPGPAVARIGDLVVGLDGETIIGSIFTGSSKVFAAD